VQRLVEYEFLRTTEELSNFVPTWRRLWESDPRAMPFQSPDWLVPWWRQFGNQELCSLVIAREGKAIGFLPFYVYQDAAKKQRQLLPLGVGTTDYLDGVFAPECGTEEIQGAVEVLRRNVEHDLFCAPQLPEHSRLLEALNQRSEFAEQHESEPERVFVSQSDGCSRMAAVPMNELPLKIRRNAMYYRNRAQRQGRLELEQADETNWELIFEELRRLHTLRWQMRGEDGVLGDERVVRWHDEAIPLLLRAGLLRLMALTLDGRVIAVLYSLIDREREGRVQCFYITAYSPEHADLRPGTLLIAYALERAAQEGVVTVDMLRGDEGYKQIWHMEKVPTWCVTQFAKAETESRLEETAA
jgi:CelD/BcsL family acetyltransferase involved in cellulose biosynthesis